MKKKYISPIMTVVKMRSQSQLLSGSMNVRLESTEVSDSDDDFEQY